MAVSVPQNGTNVSQPRPVVDPAKLRRKGWIMSISAALLAILAGTAISGYLAQLEAEIGMKQAVVVAAVPIPARALITPDMLTTTELPVKYLASSYILDLADFSDGSATALINIAPGEYLQQNMVSRNAGLEPGSRAVTIAVNGVTSVGNSVRQGNLVDIVVSYTDPSGRLITELLLQQVEVLAVDTLLPAQGGTGGQTYLPAGVDGEVKLAPTTLVTLELGPEDALKVTHAANFANEVRLLIRRLDETGAAPINPVEFIGGQPNGDVLLPPGYETLPAPAPQNSRP